MRLLTLVTALALSATAHAGSRPLAIPGHPPPPRPEHPGVRPPPPPAPAPYVTFQAVRPYHGVFVYGPRPVTHVHYRPPPTQVVVQQVAPVAPTQVVVQQVAPAPPPPVQVQQADLPRRWVERDQTFALGVRGGSLIAGYRDGTVFGDFGLGLVGRYRPAEMFAVELLAAHHNEGWGRGTERAQTLGQASGVVFLTPWARVSPYFLGGLTLDVRHVDQLADFDDGARRALFGPHGGLGLEIAIGRSLALDLDGRFTGWVNLGDEDGISPRGAFQVAGGLVAHF